MCFHKQEQLQRSQGERREGEPHLTPELAGDASSLWKGSPSCCARKHPCDLNGTALDTAVLSPSLTLLPKGLVPSLKPVVEPVNCFTYDFSTVPYTREVCRRIFKG